VSLHHFSLIRNVGQFDSVNAGAQLPLLRLALVYGENGRGKTTLSAILRSLRDGGSTPIEQRRRLGATHAPHVVVDCDGSNSPAVFQASSWTRIVPDIVVFDDKFVDDNVFSGLSIDADHRQHLNEIILGDRGVALNRALQQSVEQIEQHNRSIRRLGDAIPASARQGLTADDFCAIQANPHVAEELQDAERALAAVNEAAAIQRMPLLAELDVPPLEVGVIAEVISRDLPSLDNAALVKVEQHIGSLGSGAATWLAEGMHRLSAEQRAGHDGCPFCAQALAGVQLIDYYRAYFSDQYADLVAAIERISSLLEAAHGDAANRAFAQVVEDNSQRWLYWSRFTTLPPMDLDLEHLRGAWSHAYETLRTAIGDKKSRPLEKHVLAADSDTALKSFDDARSKLDEMNARIVDANRSIRLVKERAAGSSPTALQSDISRLRAQQARMIPDVHAACTAYLAERAAKAVTEQRRDQARASLDTYRETVFPAYQDTINLYLRLLNAEFRVESVASTNTRGGASCTDCLVINSQHVQLSTPTTTIGPSFGNALSAGDRNTLALAFFFSSLENDPQLADKIIVIDDPMTSLDEHRLLATAQQIRRFSQRASQLVLLSHDKTFLSEVWDGADRTARSAMQIVRDGAGSTFRQWDVNADLVGEHDHRIAALIAYTDTSTGDARGVAESLRPVLERYLRVSYADQFGPNDVLGAFVDRSRTRIGIPRQLLSQVDTDELNDLKEYANRFHHDTNTAASTEHINDVELLGFVRRVVAFIRRP
jgi:wobble nucleotide-excising tRNase